ncbi:hydratase [Vibrio alginolyticus]|nr:hydratase [Vibrio alginolyticus]
MTDLIKQAASELLSRRVAGIKAPRLDNKFCPTCVEDAVNIQSSMIDLHTDRVGGWKCLQPLAEDKFVLAPIFADTVQRGSICELYRDNGVARIEPEIAFVLAKPLVANHEGYSEEQINDAIGSCHMALELMQSRFADDSGAEFFERLADGLMNQGLFIGPEIDREKAFDASKINVTVAQPENTQQFAGKHPNTLAQTPVYWFINYMTRRGVDFQANESIITGSYCGIVEVEFDKPTTITYEGIGEYTVEFKEKN